MIKVNTGDRYGRYTVIREAEKRKGKRYLFCKCDCGNEKEVRFDSLRNSTILSCGCYNKEMSKQANTTHGQFKTRLYRIWRAMKSRCYSKNNQSYKNYGGRGICICEEWMDFLTFQSWAIQNGYEDNLSIERLDVNGNYEPSNCTWITMDAQKRNTTITKRIEFQGRELTLRQWAKEIGVNVSTLCYRFRKGWPLEKVLARKNSHV